MNKPLSNEFGNGIVFSRGEQQKIAIARILYGKYSIIAMDEPASALDPVSKTEIINLSMLWKTMPNKRLL